MAQPNYEKLKILMTEIYRLASIMGEVDKGIESMDKLTGQKQEVFNVLPVTPRDGGMCPIHVLLSCGPLTHTEMPLDVLDKLLESGFGVNSRYYNIPCDIDIYTRTCLSLAIQNEHYNAARWLVQHGADPDDPDMRSKTNDFGFDDYYKGMTPLAELASKENAPLDLFDVLATPRSLNDDGDTSPSPLLVAVKKGRTENALRLIKLGSRTNAMNLIRCYLESIRYNHPISYYHEELFTHLIPSDTCDVLRCVFLVLQDVDIPIQAKSKILHRLFQYLPPADHPCLGFLNDRERNVTHIILNEVGIAYIRPFIPFQLLYVWCVLLVNLGWSFASTPKPMVPLMLKDEDVQLARKIEDTWNTYKQSVISLQNLCIQQTRRSMRNFSEESFMSMPLPNKLRKLLMYQHVAELACDAIPYHAIPYHAIPYHAMPYHTIP